MATTGSRGSRGSRKMQKPAAIVPESLIRKGFQIRGLGPLPKGFDPMKATARQLAAHRLPRRPDAKKEPQLRELWDRTMSRTQLWITPPSGTTLTGNVAEWIVERPTVGGSIANLTDYAACYFDECIAGGAGNIDNLNGASLITMTGTGSSALSVPAQENDHVVKLNWSRSS
jgi:Peptidase A4 family